MQLIEVNKFLCYDRKIVFPRVDICEMFDKYPEYVKSYLRAINKAIEVSEAFEKKGYNDMDYKELIELDIDKFTCK